MQYGHLLDDPEKGALIGASARTALERGRAIPGHAYAKSLRAVNELRLYVDSLFDRYDLVLTPTTAIPAFDPKDRPTQIAGREIHAINGFYPYTFPFNMSQHPAATVSCGFIDGASGKASPLPAGAGIDNDQRRTATAPPAPLLPAGLQVIGRRGDDAGVLRACAAFEMARPWQDARPALA